MWRGTCQSWAVRLGSAASSPEGRFFMVRLRQKLSHDLSAPRKIHVARPLVKCALIIAEKLAIQAATRIQEGDEDPFS